MNIAEQILRAKQDFDDVYDAGYAAGKTVGGDTEAAYDDGYNAGTVDTTGTFWDLMQNYGARVAGLCTFRAPCWTDENFKPKYTVYASTATFSDGVDSSTGSRCGMTDLRPETVGVEIDWSLNTNFNGSFMHTPVKHVGIIDMSKAQYASTMFYQAKSMETIEKIILPDKNFNFGNNAFLGAPNLREVRFERVFRGNVSFASCPLDKASIENIMGALSTSSSGFSVTFKGSAVDAAFETSQGATDGRSSPEWTALVAEHNNWTITLA